MIPKTIQVYYCQNRSSPFNEWLYSLRDNKGVQIILSRIDRLAAGNSGDCKAVGLGVLELRIHFGPGYRVYFANQPAQLVILLSGGDKSSQIQDIMKAHEYWMDYKRRGL